MIQKPLVFISCGQYLPHEKQLGKDIADLVESLTPAQAYFAENQQGVDSLSANIFANLDRAAGFIAVMHHRGTVSRPNEPAIIRASVWIEQEIAIVSFLRYFRAKQLEVAAFVEKGIQREGVREQLILNPQEFTDAAEVLSALRNVLPTWKSLKAVTDLPPIDVSFSNPIFSQGGGSPTVYRLKVTLTNSGSSTLSKWWATIYVPTILEPSDGPSKPLPENHPLAQSHRAYSYEPKTFGQYNQSGELFPGDESGLQLRPAVGWRIGSTQMDYLSPMNKEDLPKIRVEVRADGYPHPVIAEMSIVEYLHGW